MHINTDFNDDKIIKITEFVWFLVAITIKGHFDCSVLQTPAFW